MGYIGCPHCGRTIDQHAAVCQHCGHSRLEAASAGGSHYCTQCGALGKPTRIVKGSFMVEVMLYFLMILPGVIYSLWRLTSKYDACPFCKAPNMIPRASPVAQAALAARKTG